MTTTKNSKPSWKDAPEWANVLIRNKVTGMYAWLEKFEDGETLQSCTDALRWTIDVKCWKVVEQRVQEEPTKDVINNPRHYEFFEDKEAIEIIARSMTREQFYGYCFGNKLKYKLRVGEKDEVLQEIGKANKYSELFETFKHYCYVA